MEGAPTLLKIPESECPDFWIRPPKHKWPKVEDPVGLLERNLYGHPSAGLSWERQFERDTIGKKFRTGNVYSLTESKDHSYQCVWTMSNWQARHKT